MCALTLPATGGKTVLPSGVWEYVNCIHELHICPAIWASKAACFYLCQTFISVCNHPATRGQLSLPSLWGW